MASNRFGTHFSFTTWGESHGPEMGVVIDGCPPGITLDLAAIQQALTERAPGNSPWTSPRKEADIPEILSGLYDGTTTGHPIAIRIKNNDAKSNAYKDIENLLRPGHANATYLAKYGIFDPRGGGRASARETACRVAAAAVAEHFLSGIEVTAYLKEIAGIKAETPDFSHAKKSPIRFADPNKEQEAIAAIEEAHQAGDSVGGVVEVVATGVPAGLGDPVYERFDARLAYAMLSIPASKGFEIGAGFEAPKMLGSEHNDPFISREATETNHSGGMLGGITTGMPIVARVAFKPTSSIQKRQKTVSLDGTPSDFILPAGSRHDPCVAIRGASVVRAMMLLVIADYWVKEKLWDHKRHVDFSLQRS